MTNDGAASVYGVATRLTQLNSDGTFSTGNLLITTTTLTKFTFTPNLETGDDLTQKNAAGDLCVRYKHADMVKRYDIDIEICSPDEQLESAISAGLILTDNSTALTTPTAPAGTGSASGGTLPAGSYTYVVTALSNYGETVGSAASTAVTTTGSASSVALTATAVANAIGYKWYGRTAGAYYLLGQTTSPAFTDTGLAATGGGPPVANTTAGPGVVGYQAPALGVPENVAGFSAELWTIALVNGNAAQSSTGGGGRYRRWVFPWVRNITHQARSIDNTIMANMFSAEAYENTAWGSGPRSDWPFDSTKVWQRARTNVLPVAGYGTV